MDGLVPQYLPFVRPSRAWLEILPHVYRWVVRVERPLIRREAFFARVLEDQARALQGVFAGWVDAAQIFPPPLVSSSEPETPPVGSSNSETSEAGPPLDADEDDDDAILANLQFAALLQIREVRMGAVHPDDTDAQREFLEHLTRIAQLVDARVPPVEDREAEEMEEINYFYDREAEEMEEID